MNWHKDWDAMMCVGGARGDYQGLIRGAWCEQVHAAWLTTKRKPRVVMSLRANASEDRDLDTEG